MIRSFGHKSLIVLTLVLGLVLGSTMGPMAATAAPTDPGRNTDSPRDSNCGTEAPSGSSYMYYSESYSGAEPSTYNGVTTADADNCPKWVSVQNVVRTVKGSVVTYTATNGVTFKSATVSIVNPHDSRQTGMVDVPLKSGTTSFKYNFDYLPVFVYQPPKKNGKAQKIQYVRKVTYVYLSGYDANYPAPPAYGGGGKSDVPPGCEPNGCG